MGLVRVIYQVGCPFLDRVVVGGGDLGLVRLGVVAEVLTNRLSHGHESTLFVIYIILFGSISSL